MTTSNWNLLFYAVLIVISVITLGWSVGNFCYSRKMKRQRENEDFMTKKEFSERWQEQQENCPQMVTINNQLKEILEYSKNTATATKHLKECFLLFLSQTEIDDGVRNYIHEKLTDQVKQIKV